MWSEVPGQETGVAPDQAEIAGGTTVTIDRRVRRALQPVDGAAAAAVGSASRRRALPDRVRAATWPPRATGTRRYDVPGGSGSAPESHVVAISVSDIWFRSWASSALLDLRECLAVYRAARHGVAPPLAQQQPGRAQDWRCRRYQERGVRAACWRRFQLDRPTRRSRRRDSTRRFCRI